MLVGAMALGFVWSVYKHRFRPRMYLAGWFLIAFLGLVTLSTGQSVSLTHSVYGAVRRYEGLWAWFAYGGLFFASFYFIDKARYKWVPVVLVSGGWFASIYGILQHFHVDFLPRHIDQLNTTRSFSFFDNANYFATYLVMIIILAIGLYLVSKHRFCTVILFFSNLTIFAAMLYSGTRGAWISMLVGTSLFVWLIRKSICWKRFALLMVGFMLVFIVISSEDGMFLNRFLSIGTEYSRAIAGDPGAGASRLYIWKNALPLIPQYFWLGSGPDTFQFVFTGRPFHNAHNLYIHLAITVGVPALLSFLAAVMTVLTRGFRSVRQLDGREQIIRYAMLTSCVGYMVQMLFNVSVIVVAPFFWSLLGVNYSLACNEQPFKSKS